MLRQPGDMLGFVDVTNPATPRQVGTYPGFALGIAARGNICCAAMYWSTDEDHFRFEVLDISNPDSVSRLGYLNDIGGYDVHLDGPLAFVSGFQSSGFEFTIISIADSTNPSRVGGCTTPGANSGVWSRLAMDRAFVADRSQGLTVVDISNLNNPSVDTSLMKACLAQDIWVDGDYAFVADYTAGLRILDVSDPAAPVEIGSADTATSTVTYTATARDSFAYMGWANPPPFLRSVDVSDPASPVKAGGCDIFDLPQDLVLTDTLLYVAQRLRFQVVNVARPREPELVGKCELSGTPTNLWLTDTLAFASKYVINVANPILPVFLGTLPTTSGAVAVRDTFLFAPELFDSMSVFSIASVMSPRKVASLVLTGGHIWNEGIELVDSLLYIGGDILHVVSVADPLNPREVGYWYPPWKIRRLLYDARYLYAACWNAGVCILETTSTGLEERVLSDLGVNYLKATPTITAHKVALEVAVAVWPVKASVYDIAGNKLKSVEYQKSSSSFSRWELDLSEFPAGVYIVCLEDRNRKFSAKVVKTKRR